MKRASTCRFDACQRTPHIKSETAPCFDPSNESYGVERASNTCVAAMGSGAQTRVGLKELECACAWQGARGGGSRGTHRYLELGQCLLKLLAVYRAAAVRVCPHREHECQTSVRRGLDEATSVLMLAAANFRCPGEQREQDPAMLARGPTGGAGFGRLAGRYQTCGISRERPSGSQRVPRVT